MEKRFDIPRTIGRMAPKNVAPAAVFRNSQQLAFGALANISVTGACIATDSWLAPASDIDLTLSFYGQPCLYELVASVVWNGRVGGAGEKGFDGLQLHGVQFMLSALQKSSLYALLADEGFVHVFRPSATEFDFLLYALAGELYKLGNKMRKSTGEKLLLDPLPSR